MLVKRQLHRAVCICTIESYLPGCKRYLIEIAEEEIFSSTSKLRLMGFE